MNLAITDVKIFPSMSEETVAFEATLIVDSTPFAKVSNTGKGGGHTYIPLAEDYNFREVMSTIHQINQKLSETPPFYCKETGQHYPYSLDVAVEELLANEVETFTI